MKTTKLPSLSAFFPAFNEEGNIAQVVKQALKVLPRVANKYEVIVVNDGSKDKTREICLGLAAKYPQLRIVSQRNKGYGGALKRGFSESKNEWIFFTDADLQFDLGDLKTLVRQVDGAEMVLGYRIKRADGWKRIILAKLLKVWNRFWFNYPLEIKDTDCGFKLIQRKVIRDIEPFVSDGAMISTELILKARQAGFKWHQVGVGHFKRLSGKPTGSNLTVIWRAVKETIRLRWALWGFGFNTRQVSLYTNR